MDQARRFGVEILAPQEVTGVRVEDPYRIVRLVDDSEVGCHALLIATGVSWRKLDVPGVEALTGRGVYYGAAAIEALSYKGEDVYIVGGANSAGAGRDVLLRYAHSVTLLVRGDSLEKGMSQYLVDQIRQTPNICVRLNASVREVKGEGALRVPRHRRRADGRDRDGGGGRPVHLHRRAAARGLARRRGRARRPRVRAVGAGPAA